MESRKIIVKRGEIAISNRNILQTNISSCVSICFFHTICRVGGITHISASRTDDTTPSGKYLKEGGFFYAQEAIEGMLRLFRERYNAFSEKNFNIIVIGGLKNEGPIKETLSVLKKYKFNNPGNDIMRNFFRRVVFDTAMGKIEVFRKDPFSKQGPKKTYNIIEPKYIELVKV